jgi:hypothetical protein
LQVRPLQLTQVDPRTTPKANLLRRNCMYRQSSTARHYGLDWLRIGAFMLLILHHIGMVFVPGTWLVKAPDPVEALAWPMILVQPWRMPLLFVVSGYASRQLLARSGDPLAFLAGRSLRLLLPLLFGVALIVPPEIWVAMISFHGYPHGFVHFWSRDWLGFRAFDGLLLPNLGHLWFLAYLWTYTAALALVVSVGGQRLARAAGAIAEALAPGSRLLWLPLAFLLPLRLALLFTVPEQAGLLHDWVSDVNFVPPFLLGFLLAGSPGTWAAVHRVARPAAALAAGAGAILLLIEYLYPVEHSHLVQAGDRAAQFALAWSMVLLLLRSADLYWNHDHKLRRKLNEAVFPLYIAHQTLIVLAAWWLLKLGQSYWLTGAGILVVTLAGSWLFYSVGLATGVLRPFFGLSAVRRPRSLEQRAVAARTCPAEG